MQPNTIDLNERSKSQCMTTNYQKKTKNITLFLDCGHFSLIGGKKCPQSRIGRERQK
jgi:hypothetical protein